MRHKKNVVVLILFLLAGIVVGGFIGQELSNFQALAFLNFGYSFGISQPLTVDLGVVLFSLSFTFNFTIAGVIGMAAAAFIYKKFM